MHKEKEYAIQLRREGKTYAEILRHVKVSKSTLSIWLREVNLSTRQIQRITQKRRDAQLKGASSRKKFRIKKEETIIHEAESEVGSISERELKLIGTALYWAEGSKVKDHNHSVGLEFANTDSGMIKLYLTWLEKVLCIERSRFVFRLYLHESHAFRLKQVIQYWSKVTGFPHDNFIRVYYKKHTVRTNRKNIGEKYMGVLAIRVAKSTDLHRKVQGWTLGIMQNYGNLS